MDVFDSARVPETHLAEVELQAPWSVLVPPGDLTYFYLVLSGQCWLEADGLDQPIAMHAGDLVTLVAGDRHVWRDSLDTPIDRAHVGFDGLPPIGEHGGGGGATRLVALSAPRDSNAFVSVYPTIVVIPRSEREAISRLMPLIRLVRLESVADRPGRQAVLRRLAEIIVIELVRFALPRMTASGRNWLGGLTDRHIGRAIALMHADMARDWLLKDLAAEVGLSRAILVERFGKLVGEPPHRYLRRVRMHHAAHLLEKADIAIIEIAEAVGYRSESAFNKVFAKETGLTPGRYRNLHRER